MVDATQARIGCVGQFAVGQLTPANTIMWIIVPNSELRFVGTTAYIDLVENQRAQMSFATEMRVTLPTEFVLPAPLDDIVTTGAWSLSRNLYTDYVGSYYSAAAGVVSTVLDQSGNSRNIVAGTAGGGTESSFNDVVAMAFDGVAQTAKVNLASSNLISAGTGLIVMSAIVTAANLNDAVNSYNNNHIVGDLGEFFGLFARTGGGGLTLAYNWDGNDDHADNFTPLGQLVVFQWKHEGGNVSLRLNLGSWISAASGNTSDLTAVLSFFGIPTFGNATPGKFIEAFTCNTIPSTGVLNTAVQNMLDWAS